jgi:hypothetical protein
MLVKMHKLSTYNQFLKNIKILRKIQLKKDLK